MKKFLIVLTGGGDTFIHLAEASTMDEINEDNDVAIEVATRDESRAFESFADLIKYVQAHKIELVGEFCGYSY